ncbi:MAG: AraC family transcriptional regulator [Oscillospiraceae bacterium]|nr:AraC family transcriptional regulator [Oscillospiraceae bacterium]
MSHTNHKKHASSQEFGALDTSAAREAADFFSNSAGLNCAVFDGEGKIIYENGPDSSACAACGKLCEKLGCSFVCNGLHPFAARQSERFGGRYIYFCPIGMAFFASPILSAGIYSGAFVGGPALIMDTEDLLAGDAFSALELDDERLEEASEILSAVPRTNPQRLDFLSGQLFANAVYVSDSSHELFIIRDRHEQQNYISSYISALKASETEARYPMEKETELYSSISQGDSISASRLLNELLGHIFFYTGGEEEIYTRVTELLVVLARAAISGGANPEQIFELSHRYMKDMRSITNQEDLTHWLAATLSRFMRHVFEILDVKHTEAMHKVKEYMNLNYTGKITLEEVASLVGYSPAYFSRIFKDEMGITFKEALNSIRIEKSKTLLLSGNASIAEICSMVGFNDQSYYCKVFKKNSGVTPDRFRKRSRRIDPEKEYGRK